MEKIYSQRNMTWHEIIDNYVLADFGFQFEVNFDKNLWGCFKSVEILETLNFNLPDNIRMFAIRKEKIQKNVNAVTDMVKMYNDVIEKLTESQVCVMYIFS